MTKKKPTESEQKKKDTVAKDENKQEEEKKPDEHAPENRMSSFKLRTVTTLLMLGGFVLILSLGHSYWAILVIFLLILWFKELKALKRKKEEDMKIPFFNVINWYLFFCTLWFLFPMYLPTQTRTGITNPTLVWLSEYQKFISFCSFIAGILLFTLSLEQGTIKYQFKIFGWTLIVLLIVVSQWCAMIVTPKNHPFIPG